MNNSRRDFLRGVGVLSLLGAGVSASSNVNAGWGGERFQSGQLVLRGNNGGQYQIHEARDIGNDEYQIVWKKR